MDRETKLKIKEAQKKANEALEFQKKSGDIANIEFWESSLNRLKENRKTFLNNLGETNFLIDVYITKINSLKKLIGEPKNI